MGIHLLGLFLNPWVVVRLLEGGRGQYITSNNRTSFRESEVSYCSNHHQTREELAGDDGR